MAMIWYQLRLAIGSLRKDWGLSLAMFVCLTLGSGLWTTAASHYLRTFPLDPQTSPDLHQIEIVHPRALALDRAARSEDFAWHARTWVTFPEYEILASSGIPARQSGSFRAQVLAARPSDAMPELANARFVGADFLAMFAIPVGRGRSFTRDEEAGQAAVVVLGRALNKRFFAGQNSVGKELAVEGRSFRVVGVIDDDAPLQPPWDPVWGGRDQDALYVPLSWARPLAAWPDRMIAQSPLATSADLWRSDTVFVSFWAQMPEVEMQTRYRRYVDEKLIGRGLVAHVRDLAEWHRAFPVPPSDIVYYTILLSVGLIGAAFTTARLLLAKGLARRGELGIHRALGATRGTLFLRQMLEAAMITLPAVLAGLVWAAGQHAFFNEVALDNDVPVRLALDGAVVGGVPSLMVGLLAAAYPAWRMSRTPPALQGERI
jgi:putative ABC transport system permease protein